MCELSIELSKGVFQDAHLAEVALLEVHMSDQLQLGLDQAVQRLKQQCV